MRGILKQFGECGNVLERSVVGAGPTTERSEGSNDKCELPVLKRAGEGAENRPGANIGWLLRLPKLASWNSERQLSHLAEPNRGREDSPN
jgi:hypothetical protein